MFQNETPGYWAFQYEIVLLDPISPRLGKISFGEGKNKLFNT